MELDGHPSRLGAALHHTRDSPATPADLADCAPDLATDLAADLAASATDLTTRHTAPNGAFHTRAADGLACFPPDLSSCLSCWHRKPPVGKGSCTAMRASIRVIAWNA